MNQKRIILLDPFSGSANLGDGIIRHAVEEEIATASTNSARIIRVSVHQRVSKAQRRLLDGADLIIAGGSNLLNFRYIPFRDDRWNMSLLDFIKFKDVLLMGVGWSSYTVRSNALGAYMYKRILSNELLHSVRDSHTQQRLAKFGVTNAINTGCPTMWNLTETHLAGIANSSKEAVVFTLTDYSTDPARDRDFIKQLLSHYKIVRFWPQGARDLSYLHSLDVQGVDVLRPSIAAFDACLAEGSEYVGTRLHAGIRALQMHCRTLIISVDNRATEIAKDTGLPVVERGADIKKALECSNGIHLKLPEVHIDTWRKQLRDKLA